MMTKGIKQGKQGIKAKFTITLECACYKTQSVSSRDLFDSNITEPFSYLNVIYKLHAFNRLNLELN